MKIYNQVVKFVDESYQGKSIKHFERTQYWFAQFIGRPLTEAEAIAAYSHDIERAFRGTEKSTIKSVSNYTGEVFLNYHQQRGAEIMSEFLQERNFDDIETVTHLISRHEVGGDDMQNKLMDADSVSFFETNAEHFVNEKIKTDGYNRVKKKLDWMFDRISSEEAREIARPTYEKWMELLEENIMTNS